MTAKFPEYSYVFNFEKVNFLLVKAANSESNKKYFEPKLLKKIENTKIIIDRILIMGQWQGGWKKTGFPSALGQLLSTLLLCLVFKLS